MGVTYRRADYEDRAALARFAAQVYEASEAEMLAEFETDTRRLSRGFILAELDGEPIGFCEMALRRDYVEGTDSSPVAFCEGICVAEEHQRKGVARGLITEAERWAREQGVTEFGSDRELWNEPSGGFHLGVGFEEVGRNVFYRRLVEPTAKRPEPEFWAKLDRLVAEQELVIDRPKGSAHPRYPTLIYPLDYGYLKGTASMDGGGIDVWVGSIADRALDAIVVIVDLWKRDSEIKLLLGTTAAEKETILKFQNADMMGAILIERD